MWGAKTRTDSKVTASSARGLSELTKIALHIFEVIRTEAKTDS